MRRGAFFVFALICVFSLGCGGAGSRPGNLGTAQHVTMGQVTADYFGIVKPAIGQSSGNVSAAGLAGATFTNISMTPAKTLANTTVAFTALHKTLWTYANGVLNEISAQNVSVFDASLNGTGLIAFSAVTSTGNEIFTCGYDGSSVHQITSTSDNHFDLAWSPNGQKIAFDDGFQLDVVNANGTSPVTLANPGTNPSWSPDGSHIAFEAPDSTLGTDAIWVIPATGGSAVETGIKGSSSLGYDNPSWGPNGITVNDTNNQIHTFVLDATFKILESLANLAPASGFDYTSPSVAPDGIHLACIRFPNSGTGLDTLCLTELLGAQQDSITPDSNQQIEAPSWSPYPSPKTYVGSGGLYFTSGAGFLFAQAGDGFGSFLSFTATTPSTAVITPQTSGGSAALIFLLQADTIGSLKYQNMYYGQVFSQTINLPQTLVSISSQTGQVDTVIPAIQSNRTTDRTKSGLLVYTGRFPAVYDSKGKNLAPGGATEVVFDAKNGKLLSYR